MLQSCSGHSNNTGDIAHGEAILHFLVDICTLSPVTGFTTLCVAPLLLLLIPIPLTLLPPPLPPPLLSPLTGDGLSSLDLRFSGRGGRNAVGDDDGVFDKLLLEFVVTEFAVVTVEVVVLVDVPVVVLRPPRPFAPPFRSLLCT